MLRHGFVVMGFCFLLTAGFAQSATQINGISVVGLWHNAAIPGEHFELRADGQFSLDESGQHREGTWNLNGKTLVLHISPSSVGTAQWDGQAFLDTDQKRWVRSTSEAPVSAVKQPSASASGLAGTAQNKSGDQMPSIEQALASQFKLTKVAADGADIVTAGSVLVLHKDGLLMFSADTRVPPTTTYKNGKLSTGFGSTFATDFALSQAQPGATSANVPQRKFVAGEKFWIIGYAVNNDGVIMKFYSDPYADVRYCGQLKFPFQKHTMPPTADALQTIAEVVTAQPADDAPGGGPPAPAPAPPVAVQEAQPEKALDPIAPPPPPSDAPPASPKTIALGQTIGQVAATFGPPQKKAKVGTKEIYYYPDMKVTFVNGKVANVE